MKRALVAEQQLVEMAKLYEDEHRKLQEALQAADDSDKSVLEMIESAALEKAQWERMHEAEKQELRAQLQAAESRANQAANTSGAVEEVARLKAEVARLNRELEEERALSERVIGEEQSKHRAAVDRANELFDLYEGARSRFEALEGQLADERAAHEHTKEEMAEVKRKTARMLELVQKQKQEQQQQQGGGSAAGGDSGEVRRLEEQLRLQKQVEEDLRAEIRLLTSQVQRASRTSSRSSTTFVESLAAPPPPPPPPRTPMADRRSLSREASATTKTTSKPTAAVPSPVTITAQPSKSEGFGSMAEMAAKMAQQRAERSAVKVATAAPPAAAPAPAPAPAPAASAPAPAPAAATSPRDATSSRTEQLLAAARARIEKPTPPPEEPPKEEETVGQSGVTRSRANEILARAKALAAAAKAKEQAK